MAVSETVVRTLLVNQFYPPDIAPTGQALSDLAQTLSVRGHEVTVLCSRHSYEGGVSYQPQEERDGVRIRRLWAFGFGRRGWARMLDYLSFHTATYVAGRHHGRFDLVVCLTTPPFIGWTAQKSLGARAGTLAHWVMDLYPDVLAAHGALSVSSWVYGRLEAVARQQYSSAPLVLAIGPRMRDRLAPYVAAPSKLEWVPLWGPKQAPASPEDGRALRARRGWSDEGCVLLYSGNMGLGHRFDGLLDAARQLAGAGPVWAFAGGGRRRGELERFAAAHPAARIELLPYVPRTELPASLASADVHLVSLRDEWQGLIVPSKVQAAFSVGRPVIFVGPRENEGAEWVLASGGGWVVEERDVRGLLDAVAQARDPVERARRAAAARAFAIEHFDQERNTNRIAELLEEAAASSQRPADR